MFPDFYSESYVLDHELDKLQYALDKYTQRGLWPSESWEFGAPVRKREVTIVAIASPTVRTVVLSNDSYPEKLEVPLYAGDTISSLVHAYTEYSVGLIKKYNCHINVRRPNLYSAFNELNQIRRPAHPPTPEPVVLPPPMEPEFEVNMVEALVGWKAWKIRKVSIAGVDYGQCIYSQTNSTPWIPDQALEAKCEQRQCGLTPRENCTCGIYAADDPSGATSYGDVIGQVYGWGRYVRGSSGWRAQWAYPKSFHLKAGQEGLIDTLKRYHVEVFIQTPLRIYDPREEGYEGDDECIPGPQNE